MWTLDKAHQVGELIAAVAVIVSLIFVGLEIRENTRATEAATYQQSVAYNLDLMTTVGGSRENAVIFNKYVWDADADLTGEEKVQAQYLFNASMRGQENFYIQYQAGMISEEGWAAREPLIRNLIRSPGFDVFCRARSSRICAAHSGTTQ